MRARAEVEEHKNGRERIIVTEIPYQLNKAQAHREDRGAGERKAIEGITELRDESDKDGLRIVIEMRRGDSGEVVLNNLYAQTQLQSVFGINCVALVDGQPKRLEPQADARGFPAAPPEVVTRRTLYLLRRRRATRAHLWKVRQWRWPTSMPSSS